MACYASPSYFSLANSTDKEKILKDQKQLHLMDEIDSYVNKHFSDDTTKKSIELEKLQLDLKCLIDSNNKNNEIFDRVFKEISSLAASLVPPSNRVLVTLSTHIQKQRLQSHTAALTNPAARYSQHSLKPSR